MENKKFELELRERIEKLKKETEYQYQLTKRIIEDYGSELAGDVWNKYDNMKRECQLLKKYFEISDKELKLNLEKLILEKGNVSEIKVNADKTNYLIKFNPESILVLGAYPYLGGEYNRKSEKLTWKLRHTCRFPTGIDSYPNRDSILRNPCLACKFGEDTKDKERGIIYGNVDLERIIGYAKEVEIKSQKLFPFLKH